MTARFYSNPQEIFISQCLLLLTTVHIQTGHYHRRYHRRGRLSPAHPDRGYHGPEQRRSPGVRGSGVGTKVRNGVLKKQGDFDFWYFMLWMDGNSVSTNTANVLAREYYRIDLYT